MSDLSTPNDTFGQGLVDFFFYPCTSSNPGYVKWIILRLLLVGVSSPLAKSASPVSFPVKENREADDLAKELAEMELKRAAILAKMKK